MSKLARREATQSWARAQRLPLRVPEGAEGTGLRLAQHSPGCKPLMVGC